MLVSVLNAVDASWSLKYPATGSRKASEPGQIFILALLTTPVTLGRRA